MTLEKNLFNFNCIRNRQLFSSNDLIPSLSIKRDQKLNLDYHRNFLILIKNLKSQTTSPLHHYKFKEFRDHTQIIFDFATCKL